MLKLVEQVRRRFSRPIDEKPVAVFLAILPAKGFFDFASCKTGRRKLEQAWKRCLDVMLVCTSN